MDQIRRDDSMAVCTKKGEKEGRKQVIRRRLEEVACTRNSISRVTLQLYTPAGAYHRGGLACLILRLTLHCRSLISDQSTVRQFVDHRASPLWLLVCPVHLPHLACKMDMSEQNPDPSFDYESPLALSMKTRQQ